MEGRGWKRFKWIGN